MSWDLWGALVYTGGMNVALAALRGLNMRNVIQRCKFVQWCYWCYFMLKAVGVKGVGL